MKLLFFLQLQVVKVITLSISNEDFDVNEQYQKLTSSNSSAGAVVMFIGKVRDFSKNGDIAGMYLEHYPEMTEYALNNILQEAVSRWQIDKISTIHRVGKLSLNDQIVFVGVTSHHREDAFSAAQFIMDYLKNDVPIWKKEITQSGEQMWATYNQKEQHAKSRWQEKLKI